MASAVSGRHSSVDVAMYSAFLGPVARRIVAAGSVRVLLTCLAFAVGDRLINCNAFFNDNGFCRNHVAAAELAIEPLRDGAIFLHGPDARTQILVSRMEGSSTTDQTRNVRYSVVPDSIAAVDRTGLVTPLHDGTAIVTVQSTDNLTATASIVVKGFDHPPDVDFSNDIVPIFTKLGCNGGGCHGKSGGQNGFRLSLLGFYPADDYEFLVKEDRGRRLFPAAPSESLLLTKAIARVPHGGGKRMEESSAEYRALSRWIAQGMPRGDTNEVKITRIECVPAVRVLERQAAQQIAVVAHYTDGNQADVTRAALFEANDSEMAEASPTGLISTRDLAGEVAIMARYQGQVSVFRVTIPLQGERPTMPEPANFVDRAVFAKLGSLGIPPSDLCDDPTFLRRVTIDIAGRLPTAQEVEQFLNDSQPDKRERAVDRLLASPDYADYFANKWSLLLRNKKRHPEDATAMYAFYRWIWQSLYDNKPYDQFVREILTASGDVSTNPAVAWYREVDQVEEQVEDTSQLFLGMRIQCARCHHHPFEKWSQDDYYGLVAYFSQLETKSLPVGEAGTRVLEKRVYHKAGIAHARNPQSQIDLPPRPLSGAVETFDKYDDPRFALAGWLTDSQNPFFGKALVNRYWKHFMGRGIVEPEDDMRETNPPTNPELLNALADNFVASGYDFKALIRAIVLSKTYQLAAESNDRNASDKKNFSRFYPKRLPAEVLFDSLQQVTGTTASLAGLPAGSRAVQLIDATSAPYFLKVFGQPQGDTACECERSQESNLAQSLHLLNSTDVQQRITSSAGMAARLARDTDRDPADRVRELYVHAYGRVPRDDELKVAVNHVRNPPGGHSTAASQAAFEDLLWALINTKEFLFNH